MIKRFVSAALCAALVFSMATSAFALNVVTMFGAPDAHQKPFEAQVKKFEAASGVSVTNNSSLASETWRAALVTDFNTGNEPDVLYFFTDSDFEQFKDKVVPYDTIKAAYPDFAKDINAGALESIRNADGKIYAVPFSGGWQGLFVNKDIFDKFRLEYPTNWDNFTKSFKTLNDNRITPVSVGFANEPHYLIEHLILSAGGAKEHDFNFGADISKVPASWIQGLDMLKTLADQGAFGRIQAASSKTEVAARLDFFGAGVAAPRSAMMVNGSWLTGGINNAGRGNSVQVFPMPAMPGGKGDGTQVIGGYTHGYMITKKAWDNPATQKQAVDFVNFLSSKDSVKAIIQPGNAPAANIAVGGGALVARSGMATSAQASSVSAPADSWLAPAAWAEIWPNAINIASGKMTATEVLQNAVPLNK